MNFLLDTNVISEVTRPLPSARVVEWIVAQTAGSLYISVITLGELQRGALLLPDGKKRKTLSLWIETGIKAGWRGCPYG